MKVENLKIGKTYYMPTTGFYTCGELIKITKDKCITEAISSTQLGKGIGKAKLYK